jgi:phenol hydroxylase P4 protein
MIVPWAEEDPDFDPKAVYTWSLHGEPLVPDDETSLEDLGVVHKDVIGMRVVAG